MISFRILKSVTAICLVLVLLIPLLPANNAEAAATLKLSRRSAEPGESVTATGKGFPQGTDGTLALAANGQVLGSVGDPFQINRGGSFKTAFTVPALEAGTYEVVAIAGEVTQSAQLEIKVEPTPTQTIEPPATTEPEDPATDVPAPSETEEPQATEEPETEAPREDDPATKTVKEEATEPEGSRTMPATEESSDGIVRSAAVGDPTFNPKADAWTTAAYPTRNYGTDLELTIDNNPVGEAFLRFDVSGLTGGVTSAKLRVFVEGPSVSGPDVYGTGGNWTETGITHSNRPGRTTAKLASRPGATGDNVWIEYDITAFVTGNGTYNVVLVGTSGDGADIYSREGTNPPQLVITPGGSTQPNPTPAPTKTTTTPAPSPTATKTATATATATKTATATSVPGTPPPATGNLSLRPAADVRANSANPSTNFGSTTTLNADNSPLDESFLRFQVSGTGGNVKRATLRLYASNGTTRPTNVYGVAGGWTESGLTWNNRPARSTDIIGQAPTVPTNGWVEYDVTTLVRGDGAVDLVVVNPSSDGAVFSSREGSQAPQLVIETSSGTPGTTTPTATATTTPAMSVAITKPATGTTYTSNQVVVLEATVTGSSTVSRVEFYDNGVLAGSEDTVPFGYSWSISNAQNGTHTWTAKAIDASGKSATSAAINLTVNIAANGTPTPGGPVTAAAETAPVPNSGDAADDPAIWIHPSDPSLSTVIGTDKLGGLAVYDLSGKQLFYYADSAPNNVDLRYNFPLGGQRRTIVASSDRNSDSIKLYTVDPGSRGLTNVEARTISTGIGVAGLCMYVSPTTGKYYVFVGDNSGTNQQWELYDNGSGKIDAKKVRTISLGSTTEACVADDGTGALYLAEEDVAIWRYGAEPDAGSNRSQVAAVGSNLSNDIEGLAIYYGGSGYLIASSQGSNDYAVFSRGSSSFIGKFKVEAGTVDEVSYTDGLDVTNVNLGGAFASGMFVAQDDRNDSGNQSFKLVPWDRIAKSFSSALSIDTGYDPRGVGGGGSTPPPPPSPSATATATATPRPSTTPTPTTPTSTPTPAPTTPPQNGAKTYYVDSAVGNDANAGTSTSTPWKSLAKVNGAALNAGDRVLFKRGGSWSGKLTLARSGSASSPIVISSYGSGNLPIITGGSTCVTLSGSYITVQEFKITTCGWSGVEITGSNNRLEKSTITDNVAGVYVKSGATNNSIVGNQIVDNKRMSVNTPGGDDDSGAFGVLIHGDSTDVSNNTISGQDAASYDYGRDGAAIEIYGGKGNHIHHNIAVDNDAFVELGNSRATDNTFAYNVVRSSLDQSVFLVTRGSGSGYGPVLRTKVLNNTVYLTGASSQGFVCHSGCGPDILTMRNNVIQAVLKVGYADKAFDEDYNLYFGGQTQFTMGSRSKVANPSFVNPGSGDLRLNAGSPGIDAGVEVGYSTDVVGAAVPRDGDGNGSATPDMGAYER